MAFKRIVVLGDGGWGTTLALMLHKKGVRVTLWSAFPEYAHRMRRTRRNPFYLKGVPIPAAIDITSAPDALWGADGVVVGVPSQYLRGVLERTKRSFRQDCPVISVVKGIEFRSLLRMSQVIAHVWGARRVAVLSGPTIAFEVARGIPSTAVAASDDAALMRSVQKLFMAPAFRVYTNSDVTGVELGGSLKNIIAIACGISDGLGFGSNTKAALVSRGLAEMSRLGRAMGARPDTFAGIAGLGDLVTTCFSGLSRNHNVGAAIGRGRTLKDIMGHMRMVAEGVPTARAVWRLSRRLRVDMPITEEIYRVLFQAKSPRRAVEH
ncbi:MAG: NAD(P)H-dependent glycerol-3-phosphate dehydrogenase, partial [Deltaproteobacteria bacterium]